MFIKILLALVLLIVVYFVAVAFSNYLTWRHYIGQGLPASSTSFSLFRDVSAMMPFMEDKSKYQWNEWVSHMFGGKIPGVHLLTLPTETMIGFASADYLEDLYVKQNAQTSKSPMTTKMMHYFMPTALIFALSEQPQYHERRKIMSAAFFKSKIKNMTHCIKEVTLKEIKRVQESGENSIDINQFTQDLQMRIIINVAVGAGMS